MTTDANPDAEADQPADPPPPGRVVAAIIRHPRRAVAVVGLSGIGIAVTASVITLAVTHNTARDENLKAYINGLLDAYNTMQDQFLDIVDY